MSRDWPSGWEDPEDVELDAEELDEETDVRLAEVAAFLAAVPAPVLPGAIESRIVAALAAESVARAEDSPAHAPEPDAPRILHPRPARARVRRPRRARPAMFDRIRPAMVAGPLVACLLFAGLGYAISRTSSSSSSNSAPYAAPAASSAASGAGVPANGSAGSVQRSEAGSVASGGFAVTKSGTDYREATLAVQVRAVIAAVKRASSPAVPSPASSSSSAAASSSGSEAVSSASASAPQYASLPNSLRGCVVHFTGRAAPRLIDRASYQGTPVYVIASASHVWVVGLDCTAGRPDLIASASLGS
jgi:hypothetical protein